MKNSLHVKELALGAGFCLALAATAFATGALAASADYCTVYAHAASDPAGNAAASADDTEALQRAYDKAYYECLNLDDEPKLPADFADRGPDPSGLGEGDISDDEEKPAVTSKPAAPALKQTASAASSKKKKQWESGHPAGSPEWAKWCKANFKSFDAKTGQYKAFSGAKKTCK